MREHTEAISTTEIENQMAGSYVESVKKRSGARKWLRYIFLTTFVLVFTSLFGMMATILIKDSFKKRIGIELPHTKNELVKIERIAVPDGVRVQPNPRNQLYTITSGFCGGGEVLCSTLTTANPAEALSKLVTAIPKTKNKTYYVQISVENRDE